jgi:protein-S-isoprenylcysteine O-methyltransferase Ste14
MSDNDVVLVILSINLIATLVYFWIIANERRMQSFFGLPMVVQKSFVVLFVAPLFVSPVVSQNKYDGHLIGNVVGGVVALIGLVMIVMAFFGTGVIPSIKEKSSLATTGVYGVVRHPIYAGTIVTFAGLNLLFEAVTPFLYLPLSICLYYVMTVYEEKGLVAEYGEEYSEYKKRVRKRIIPFVL